MSDPEDDALLDEAADIFIQLRETPDDRDAISARDAFLARGPEACAAYDAVERAWTVGGGRKRNSPKLPVVIVLCLLSVGMLLWPEARIYWLADIATSHGTEEIEFTSGDVAILDADTSLVDRIGQQTRGLEILEGAAFFEVTKDDRPFRVTAGDLTVSALGTAFEVAFVGDSIVVAMNEGRVLVEAGSDSWTLEAGQKILWSADGRGKVDTVDPERVAGWRAQTLDLDGLTLGQAAAILNRRLPGDIYIPNTALAATTLTGSVNLDDPLSALRIMAAANGARVLSFAPVATLITTAN